MEIDAADLTLRCQGYRIDVVTAAAQALGDMAVEYSTHSTSEDALAYLNRETHPGQPDRVSRPVIIGRKIHHNLQLKKLLFPERFPSRSSRYDGNASLRDALQKSFDRIGCVAAGINILDIPWELNNKSILVVFQYMTVRGHQSISKPSAK